ncbi:hypothetical protein PLA107_031105 (plasmid) [Pseudomonas amygdali pv. lachrymans str. M301315]|uniref:Uncharacterized protein n=1 Tax=Pseudomonas amygdali pv. lachrymans str. M301315 TaxID=629260 RepID=A0AAD0PVS9_PSEAV|nr:hypothetical protein PLA107_031105 [Pseudomonas amygdali pv. lachrymans str. M301315]RMT06184.1 hypothetical protein ALP54_03582 [Pseudomonas amygdali pv. lachrymans]
MSFRRLLRTLFPPLFKIPAKKPDGGLIAHMIVRRYSRGNANLQRGRYITADQLELRKRRLASHNF